MPWPIMYWKEGYKGFHSDCALNHVRVQGFGPDSIMVQSHALHPELR